MRRKSGVEKKMQITYQNEWEYTNIHVDLPIPYEDCLLYTSDAADD